MANIISLAILTVFSLFGFCDAAPRSLDVNDLGNLSAAIEPEVSVRYDGAQLWNVEFNDDKTKRIVVDLKHKYDVSFWSSNGSNIDMFLTKSAVDDAAQTLREANIKFDVIIDDYQKEIDNENPSPEEIEIYQNRNARFNRLWRGYKMPDKMSKSSYLRLRGAYLGYNSFDQTMATRPFAHWGHRLTWRAYHRLADIFSFLDYLVVSYPDLCSVQTIGHSHQKRPLKVLKISNGNTKNRAIWIDGGIHAREWISPASVTYFVNNLVENWEDQPAYMRNVDWYILPVLNPDGYEYTHQSNRLWRKNRSPNAGGRCMGVDLNRNYGYKWGGKGTSRDACQEIYCGKHAFSEPETYANKQFFDNVSAKFDAFLTFHSYGQYVLHPWGYEDVVPPDYADLDRVGEEGAKNIKAIDGQVYSVGPSAALLYPAAGGSDDWAKSVGIKYSFTVELRDKGRHGFVLPAQYIIPTGKEAQAFIETVARNVARIKRKDSQN